ncbi:MAG: translation elongation factor Ts [Defluviitaleaceae bacterium]|nr:translation elongation factor Ts [Defluviitaleaceae bacterium]
MAVNPALIKELRELTGSGMSDCKKALEETGGDIKKAVEFLREKGLAAAEKKSGRIAAEGVVAVNISSDYSKAVIVEVNCETDFVAINDQFKGYVQEIADQLVDSPAADVEGFLTEDWKKEPGNTVSEVLKGKIATIGENLNIRRFERFQKQNPGIISSYIHGGGKIGVILDIDCEKSDEPALKEMAYNICMQIAAMFPKYLRAEDVDAEFIENERRILTQAAKNDPENAGKPEHIIEKMIEGRVNKFLLKEVCLLEQDYVKEGGMNVKQYVAGVSKAIGVPITLVRFVCYEKGEGIEKKQENFADEVNKAING